MRFGERPVVPEHQADAVLSQANPVSGTLYTVLDTTKNVRLISAIANITWAVTQPTLLEVLVTIDSQVITFLVANPVSAINYRAVIEEQVEPSAQPLSSTSYSYSRSFLLEGRSVKIEVRITWATTQPTPLVCRVKWARF